ncbi:reverse transcriptase domain-containing protein [Tanacetum coccineum]|uniref:Reverse transcriptase domain-containing protein n=1 Tax=Tanacetum coccineum TaxID=301880 RepID=A0ABQ5F008_9ASTR
MIKDVEETLLTLKKVNMKLNPKKCSFGIEEGNFLGYIVTSEGIRANPEKVKVVVSMPSPSNLKQMQRLSGKLAALNRFLSKAVKRAQPCLDTLKKCTNKKDFHWTTKAEEAFQTIKKLIAELPTLTAPKKEEELMVYLSAANEAVSAVLLVEREGRQAPIHYVSRTLQGAEINYPPMEKLALAVVHAARRLRRYFQGHTIKVITDKPISQILNNQEAMGRLAKLGVELEAYGIKYTPKKYNKRTSARRFLGRHNGRGQLYTNIWKLYTDGASNEHRSGAGLILIDPEGAEYSHALRLNFANSNNDVKYEALLAGLRIATKIKVGKLHALVDSKLVASQVEGSYEAKELNERLVDTAEVNAIIEEATRTWMTSIQEYIEKKILPEDVTEARTIREKARNYTIEEGVLYQKSYLGPLLRCIGPQQAKNLIKEIHMGSCRMHDGPRRAVHKAMNAGYFWPSIHQDANNEISSCDSCQVYATIPKLPKNDMISVTSAWPFQKTTPKTSNEETPFSLAYGTEAVIPAEIGIPTRRTIQRSDNEEALRLNLNLLEERRELAAIREARRKQQVEKYYNQRVCHKQFKVG